MPVRKLETVDAFVLTDFADVPASGYVRRARKILQSSTWDLARSATYTFASFGVQRGGASAGINAVDDVAGDAIASLRAELAGEAEDGRLLLLAGKGVRPVSDSHDNEEALVAGVVAAAEWALGGSLAGRKVAVEGGEAVPDGLLTQLSTNGAELVTVDGVADKPWLVWGADADVILVGSKPGAMNHQGAEMLQAPAVVPWGPTPITTKALAVMLKNDVVYVPDFITASGPLLAGLGDAKPDGDVPSIITAFLDETGAAGAASSEPLFLAACRSAETFLSGWQNSLPFGRPLAG